MANAAMYAPPAASKLLHETNDSEARRDVKGFSFRDRAPGHEAPLGIVARPVGAVEIDSPFRASVERLDAHRRQRNTHLARPDVALRVHARRVLEARVPAGVVEGRLVLVNLEVDPLVVGRHLKLIVVVHAL